MNPTHRAVTRLEQLYRAVIIKHSIGTYTAARYLYKRKWSLEAALNTLARRP